MWRETQLFIQQNVLLCRVLARDFSTITGYINTGLCRSIRAHVELMLRHTEFGGK
jgi:hypothetical protein